MGKAITEMGYTEKAVVCGKFFDLQNVMTLQEMAEYYGGEYDDNWRRSDEHLIETFENDGYEFLGCVAVKKELEELEEYIMGGYLVRGNYLGKRKRLYIIWDIWDEARGQAEYEAFRYSIFTSGSFDYDTAQRIYKKVMGKK